MISANSILLEIEKLIYKEVISIKDEKTAIACSAALINCLHLNFKNRLMYIPSTYNNHTDDIYSSIYRDFTGNNHQDLAVKYNRSSQNIYSIIKRESLKQIRKTQSDLFQCEIIDQEKRTITIIVLEEYLPTEFLRCGLKEKQAKKLSLNISNYICSSFPGVSIYISEALKNKINNKNQLSIF